MPENEFRVRGAALDRLLAVTDRLRRHIDQRLASESRSLAQQRVLRALLLHSGHTDQQVRAFIGMESPQFSRERKVLVDDGLVKLTPSPDHRGQFLLTLSEAGKAAAAILDEARIRASDDELLRLALDEKQMIYNALGFALGRKQAARPALSIRVALRAELPLLLQFAQRYAAEMMWYEGYTTEMATLLGTLYTYSNERQGTLADSSHHFGWIARVDEKPVGAAILEQSVELGPDANLDLRPRIHLLWVAEQWRDKGIGGKLLDACLTEARRQEEKVVLASLPISQTIAGSLLKKRGFREVGKLSPRVQYGVHAKWRDLHLRMAS